MNTDQIQTALARIDPASSLDLLLEAFDKLDAIRAWLKERDAEMDALALEWIRANGTLRFQRPDGTAVERRLAKKKTTKCIDIPGTIQELLETVDGDFDRFCTFLASQPIKYGAAREALNPAMYDVLFQTTEEDDVKVVKIDTRFLK
jgi:hypothetical protein